MKRVQMKDTSADHDDDAIIKISTENKLLEIVLVLSQVHCL